MKDSEPSDIQRTERHVAVARARTTAEYQVLRTRARNAISSPKVIGGLLAAGVLAGFAFTGRRKKTVKVTAPAPRRQKPSRWQQAMEVGQLLLPFLGALKAASEAKSARKTVKQRTGGGE